MLYVGFSGLLVLRMWALVGKAQFRAWNGEWVLEWSEGGVYNLQRLEMGDAWLDVNLTPSTAPSHVLTYNSDLKLQLRIDCLAKQRGTWEYYYYYDGWLALSGLYNINTPSNNYAANTCLINNKPSLEPPPSLFTIVPTQTSILI